MDVEKIEKLIEEHNRIKRRLREIEQLSKELYNEQQELEYKCRDIFWKIVKCLRLED